jgi:hypothetical protein
MADTGFIDAGLGEDNVPVSGGVTENWTNAATGITETDANSAQIVTATTGTYVLPYLRASAYGFAIPTDATITGIKTKITWNSGNYSSYTDISVKLAWGASAASVSPTDLGLNTAGVITGRVYGADGEMWGTSLTPADINSSDFGWIWKPARAGGSGSRTLSADAMTITVYYTEASGGGGSGVQTRQYQSLLLDI